MSQVPANIHISTLNLRLPPGFEQRADAIARSVGQHLSQLPALPEGQFAQLQVPPLKLGGGETDHSIARQISLAIYRQLQLAGGGHALG